MNPARKRRLYLIGLMLAGVAIAIGLLLAALDESIELYAHPSDIVSGKAPKDTVLTVGGMVAEGSVNRPDDGLLVEFGLTDYGQTVKVKYEGILPDLFREGQGIVVTGKLDDQNNLVAHEVLAKHDETYMPQEAKDAIAAAEQARKAKLAAEN